MAGCVPHVAGRQLWTTDRDWMRLIACGDSDAFNRLVLEFQDRVFRSALSLMGNPHDAEELAQDVFVTVFRKAHQFRGDASLTTWIFRITHNLGKNKLTRLTLRKWVSLDARLTTAPQIAVAPDTRDRVESLDFMDRLLRLLDHLDPVSRHLITMREVHGMTYDDIAVATRIPIGTIKSKLSRAKDTLRAIATERDLRGDD